VSVWLADAREVFWDDLQNLFWLTLLFVLGLVAIA